MCWNHSSICYEEKPKLRNCPDCGTEPGQPHRKNCDVERCSVCGRQRLGCDCIGHQPTFSRWTGIWPGEIESNYLRIDLNQFYEEGYHEIFFKKPYPRYED